MDLEREIIQAFERADWQQVVLNGGPPCFHLEDGRFCLRAMRWDGHDELHRFVSVRSVLLEFSFEAEKNRDERNRQLLRQHLNGAL